jgi:hypothetical protein
MSDDGPTISDLEGQLKMLQEMKIQPDALYKLYSIFLSTLMEFKEVRQDDGTAPAGWSAEITTDTGATAFPEKADQETVEAFMAEYGPMLLRALQLAPAAPEPQAGGDPKADEATAQKMLSTLQEFVDPRSVSLDGAVEFVLEYLDSANEKMEDFSRQIGIIKLENTVSHISLLPIGIPYDVPTRLLFIILQGIFEVMRLISLFGFPGAGIFRIAGSLFGGVIELFKGDWKSALFTFMGFAGSGMMTLGLFGKVVVKVMSFMAPSKQNKLILAGYESMKSWLIGVLLFVFQTMAPPSIKNMVDENMGKLGEFLGDIQTEINKVASSFEGNPQFKCLTIEWPQIWPSDGGDKKEGAAAAPAAAAASGTTAGGGQEGGEGKEDEEVAAQGPDLPPAEGESNEGDEESEGAEEVAAQGPASPASASAPQTPAPQIPAPQTPLTPLKKAPKIDYDSLIKLQDLFAIPEFYCNTDMRAFVDTLKYIPPARIILELLGMPTTDRGYKDVCWNLPESVTKGNIAVAIIHALRPAIRPKEPGPGCPGAEEGALRAAAAAAKAQIDQLFEPGSSGAFDPKLMSAATSIRGSTDKAFGATAEAAGKGVRQVKESATKTAQQLRQFMPFAPKGAAEGAEGATAAAPAAPAAAAKPPAGKPTVAAKPVAAGKKGK